MQVSLGDGDRFGQGKQETWELAIDPSLDTNPGIMSYFFLLCQYVEAPAQPKTTESNENMHQEICRSSKTFGSV